MKSILILSCICVGAIGCGVPETGVEPPQDELYFPVSVTAHPDGRYLYIANAVFDRQYNSGTISVYDTYEHRIVDDATTQIGLLAGELALLDTRAEGGGGVVGYAAIRDEGRLLQFSLDAEATDQTRHVVSVKEYAEFGDRAFAADPYDISVDEAGLFLTHLGRGVVSRWKFARDESDAITGDVVFSCSRNLPAGATYVARHPAAPVWYVTDRTGSRIYLIRERANLGIDGQISQEECELVVDGSIAVASITSRGLAFNATGTALFVSSEFDSSVRVYDTSIGSGGRPRNRLVASVPLGGAGNVVRLAPQGASGGSGLLYVTLFDDDELVVIDPETLLVVARLDIGRGAHDLAFLEDPSGRLRGYVANFEDASISVVDLHGDPAQFSLSEIVQ